jgi:hypothetical protein
MRRQHDDGVTGDDKVLISESLAPSRKRRRTIVDAFEAITLAESNNNESAARNFDSQERNDIPATGIDDIMLDADSDDDDEASLTSSELAQREIARALVFGRRPFQPVQQRQDPVEAKLHNLIRRSIQEAVNNKQDSQCDMDIETSYNRPSLSLEGFVVNGRPRSNSFPNANSNEFNQDTCMDIAFL